MNDTYVNTSLGSFLWHFFGEAKLFYNLASWFTIPVPRHCGKTEKGGKIKG